MFTGVVAPLVRATEALEKKPTSVTAVRAELRTQVVVMDTGEVPAAVPPDTRGMVIVEGLAATVRDSPSVARRATLAVLEVELNWQTAAGATKVNNATTEISFGDI
jgi:hypothetical protein